MAKYCPIINDKVLYLDCLECDEKLCETQTIQKRVKESLMNRIVQYILETASKWSEVKISENDIIYNSQEEKLEEVWKNKYRLCFFDVIKEGTLRFRCIIYQNGNTVVQCFPHGEYCLVYRAEKRVFSMNEVNKLYEILKEKENEEI